MSKHIYVQCAFISKKTSHEMLCIIAPCCIAITVLLRQSAHIVCCLLCWSNLNYRVANKFSDTLNELFVVNCLISIFFCENTRWKLVSSPHYLKILIKSTKHGLSYSLKRDLRPISKITIVSPFDTEPWEFLHPRNVISYSNHHYLGIIKRLFILMLLFRPRYVWFT